MAGLKENDAELKGTSLEYAKPFLASFDQTRKLAEGEDVNKTWIMMIVKLLSEGREELE